jgi:hypothetical protein
VTEASKLATYSKRLTISLREIQTAVCLILNGEFVKHTISDGTESVTKFSSTGAKYKGLCPYLLSSMLLHSVIPFGVP